MKKLRTVATVALVSITLTALVVTAAGVNPAHVIAAFFKGTFSSWRHFLHVLSIWIPLALCSCGLLFTFSLGLWNIGIEGQIMLGAVGATWCLRYLQGSVAPPLALVFALIAACAFGATWAVICGLLKIKSNVHEIFSGLGLNFVAQGLLLWLIFGPWKRAGIASMSGTEPFPRELWFPVPAGWRVSPLILVASVLLMVATAWVLKSTRWGLVIRAIGNNAKAAEVYGISINRNFLMAMSVAGTLAGMVGYYQTVVVYHRLIPVISSNYGYLSLLVVMLAGYRCGPVPLIALLFAILQAGSIQLPLMLGVDSALSGVIQGILVLSALGVVHARRKA
ncbi:ABC transporter permease [Thermodesulforhabdus norvegica]|uniref:Nucleoside ABC transporter membrane protein n=1 Tax=Thermodesulforhabdus norvegica TaxID=39841 RepID=A0A1I4V186_9BACT|nr:ABC transporter permease [Thermodesulforhabdus norvegica]SFM94994.1 nucleoside ABC transporter membrane protein [Thermodesulforhabdus norvegica]